MESGTFTLLSSRAFALHPALFGVIKCAIVRQVRTSAAPIRANSESSRLPALITHWTPGNLMPENVPP